MERLTLKAPVLKVQSSYRNEDSYLHPRGVWGDCFLYPFSSWAFCCA